MRYASLREGLVLAVCPSISSGGLILPDLSRLNNHGVFDATGTSFDTTSRGVGLQLGQRVTEFNTVPINGTNDFTVSIWTNLSANQSASDQLIPVFGQKGSMAASAGWMIYYWYGGANLGRWMHSTANGSSASEILTSLAANTQGSLAHIVMRRSAAIANNGDFYINAMQYLLATSSTIRDVSTSSRLRIGADSNTFRVANQTILDARVYSRLLSEAEIQLLASEPGIGLRPERTSVFFGAQFFNSAWARNSNYIISPVGAA